MIHIITISSEFTEPILHYAAETGLSVEEIIASAIQNKLTERIDEFAEKRHQR